MNWPITLKAPAKLNLDLRVGAAKSNGRHNLYSTVGFCADIYDTLTLRKSPGQKDYLDISGPFAAELASTHPEDNLVLRALKQLRSKCAIPYLDIKLMKAIPTQAGLGGGSADAAALCRFVLEQFNCDRNGVLALAARLGGDIPVCIRRESALMLGEGETVKPLQLMEPAYALLVNPGISCPTGEVFRAYDAHCNEKTRLDDLTLRKTMMLSDLKNSKNDLQNVAKEIIPEISYCLEALSHFGAAIFHRISGSGASCFAIFHSRSDAIAAQNQYVRVRPADWSAVTKLI